jgi:hypothetical protein
LTKNGFGHILGDFLTKSSGHTGDHSTSEESEYSEWKGRNYRQIKILPTFIGVGGCHPYVRLSVCGCDFVECLLNSMSFFDELLETFLTLCK